MAEKRRVLVAIPNLGICNGVTTFIMSFYDYLLEHGYAVDFLLLADVHSEMEETVKSRGSNIYSVLHGRKYDRKRIDYIDSVLRDQKYDIVHVNVPGPNGAMVLKLAGKNGVKHRIYHCHNPLNNLSAKAILSERIFTPLCIRRANKYVACTKMAGESVFGKKTFEVINNAINPQKFLFDENMRQRKRAELGIEKRLIVGVAARITDQKNPEFLVRVFAEINKMNPEAMLLWVGDGIKQEKVQDLCRELEVQKDVLLVGRQEDVTEWYSVMDVFVLPSKFEGLGIVYLEAQANGLVCFGSDRVPEETEITDRMHRISLNRSAKEWAQEILQTYGNSKKDRKAEIELFRQKGYDSRFAAGRLYEVYESLLEKQE